LARCGSTKFAVANVGSGFDACDSEATAKPFASLFGFKDSLFVGNQIR